GLVVTYIVAPVSAAAAKSDHAARGCAPSRLSVTETTLPNLFSVPAGWPQPLSARLADDCGAPVLNGQVVASFSNGDPPLALKLHDLTNGIFSGTWRPAVALTAGRVGARARGPGFASGSGEPEGRISPNAPAVLKVDGAVNIF